ncbi:MAG: glycerol-3-phosphate 1-O-acyltransferase PlsY [Oscillospiraceae bacterium]|nr:glycerol-3-phosphate 1-O-acyltransferase PlsY [Oscillospiraceae bacterium]
MKVLYWVVVLVAGYLLGSLSFSIILSKLIGRDIRKEGSGNAGATNMTRVFGWAAGIATLLFDFLKALAAMLIGRALLGDVGICLGGIASMTGHCFPLFHNFKGGKGIATGAALGWMIDWRVFICILVVFLIVSLLSKKVSLGSVCAAVSIVPATLVFAPRGPMIALAVYGMVLAICRHAENIRRLRAGTEPDFRPGTGKRSGNRSDGK